MSLQILLNPIRDLLDQQLRCILNTGLISAKVVNANSRFSNGYIQLLFDRNDQKYHTPKIFDTKDTSQNMIRIYMLEDHKLLLDVCSRTYEIDKIETFWLPNVQTKYELGQLRQVEGSIVHINDMNQDFVLAWGSWIPLKLLKPKMIYQSDFRKAIAFHDIEDLVKAIYNNW